MKLRPCNSALQWVSAILLSLLSCQSFAASPAARAERFAAAGQAVDAWAAVHDMTLTGAARQKVVEDYFSAAIEVQSRRQLSDDVINSVAGKVVAEYLDRELDSKGPMTSLSSGLNAALGAAGLARPVARQLVRLTILYDFNPKPDSVRIGDEILPMRGSVLTNPGSVTVQGLRDSRTICAGTKVGVAGEPLEIECRKL